MIILKLILEKWAVEMWTGFHCLRIRFNGYNNKGPGSVKIGTVLINYVNINFPRNSVYPVEGAECYIFLFSSNAISGEFATASCKNSAALLLIICLSACNQYKNHEQFDVKI
jgi:hypothetical protein